MESVQLLSQIDGLPDALKAEVADFVAFLAKKNNPEKKIKARKYGCGKGFFKMAPDFDEPIEDFKDYM